MLNASTILDGTSLKPEVLSEEDYGIEPTLKMELSPALTESQRKIARDNFAAEMRKISTNNQPLFAIRDRELQQQS
jgi:hypothetical protein